MPDTWGALVIGKRALQLGAGLVLALIVLLPSRVDWDASPGAPRASGTVGTVGVVGVVGEQSELRLSWRYVAPTVQACRPPTERELAGLPQHMRPTEICDGGALPFRLRVVLDGDTLRSGLVQGGAGRALSILERFPVAAGRHDLSVDFWPDSANQNLPPGLAKEITRSVNFTGRRAVLVTLEDDGLAIR